MATKGQLLRDVRVIINENENLEPLLSEDADLLEPLSEIGADDTALERDTLLSTLIAPAIDKVHKLASGNMLKDVTDTLLGIKWKYDKHCQWFQIPENVLFLNYVNVNGWDRPVISFVSDYGNEYDMCRSGIVGVMPSEVSPVCAVMPYCKSPVIGDLWSADSDELADTTEYSDTRLEAYPLMPETAGKIVKFVAKAKTGEVAEDYEYNISGQCYWAVVYTIASLYFLSVDNKQRSEDMANEAADILKNDRT